MRVIFFKSSLDEAAHQAATSPHNDLPEPTQAQKEAGNYRKAKVRISGLDVAIENPKGSKRKGIDGDGKAWSVTMKDHYGYFNRTEGNDGDHIDVFIKPGTPLDFDGLIFVVNQTSPGGGFDEHKCMMGYSSQEEAKASYLRNYSKGWDGIGSIATMTMDEFKRWLEHADTTKPAVLAKSLVHSHNRKLKNGTVVQVAGYSDRRVKKAEADSLTVNQLIAALPPSAKKLHDEGTLIVVASTKDAPHTAIQAAAKTGRRVHAYYNHKEDKVVLIADAIDKTNLTSTLYHELYHRAEFVDVKLKKQLKKLDNLLSERFNLASEGNATDIENAAYERVISARTPKQSQLIEYKAYLVTEHIKQPQAFSGPILQWINDLYFTIRAALIRQGIMPNEITPADLNALAQYGTQQHPLMKSIQSIQGDIMLNQIPSDTRLLFFKAYVPAHTRRLKNGNIVQVKAYSDKRMRKDAAAVHVDHSKIEAKDKEQWARLHQEQHVLHHVDKAHHEAHLKELNDQLTHRHDLAAHHEIQRNLARKNGDDAALSEHNKALTKHNNAIMKLHVNRGAVERKLAKVNHKLEGIKAAKESLWKGSGEVGEKQNSIKDANQFIDTSKIKPNMSNARRFIEDMEPSSKKEAEALGSLHDSISGAAFGDYKSYKMVDNATKSKKLLPIKADLQEILKFGAPNLESRALDIAANIAQSLHENAPNFLKEARNEMPPKVNLSQDVQALIKKYKATTKESKKITPTGKENEVKTAKGTKVNTQFAVVEASELTTSHDENGNANPAYPKELQPRNRERATSQAQISRIAKNLDPDMLGRTRVAYQGAPIVGDDGVVESGNGRTMAINQAYKTGKAGDYREWLEDIADMYGLNAKQIKCMKNPVLVRVRKTDIDRAQFAREANQSDMLAMTATEKAKSDSNHLTDAVIGKLSDDGDLSAASNRDFAMAFLTKLGDDETAGLLTTSGQPTKQLYDRAQAAIFAKAYNDDRLIELMADTDKPEIGNIIKSLNQAAPSFIKARSISEHHAQATTDKITDAVEVSLDKKAVDAIVKATEMLKRAKDTNMPIDKFVKQGDMFGDVDPVVAQMALFIKDNNRSPARMGEAFKAMADFLVKELEHQQNKSLFDDDEPINIVDVIKAANDHLQKQYGEQAKTIGSRTGGFIDMFTETRGQKADRERFANNNGFDSSAEYDAFINKPDEVANAIAEQIFKDAVNNKKRRSEGKKPIYANRQKVADKFGITHKGWGNFDMAYGYGEQPAIAKKMELKGELPDKKDIKEAVLKYIESVTNHNGLTKSMPLILFFKKAA